VIIRVGDKIFPSEIEEFFETHPDVMEAQVRSLAYCNIQPSLGSW
jgi:acyl-CoA synthetase (AMP-forming)/AMP-acid ligase II